MHWIEILCELWNFWFKFQLINLKNSKNNRTKTIWTKLNMCLEPKIAYFFLQIFSYTVNNLKCLSKKTGVKSNLTKWILSFSVQLNKFQQFCELIFLNFFSLPQLSTICNLSFDAAAVELIGRRKETNKKNIGNKENF